MSDALLLKLEAPDAATNRGWVQLARTTGGVAKNGDKKFEITPEDITAYAAHIQANPDRVSIDFDHSFAEGRGSEAAGWVDASTVEPRADGHELWAQVDWTPGAAQKIRDKAFRYFSPEIAFKKRDKSGVLRQAAEFLAGALTNRPFFKDMAPVSLSESSNPDPIEGASMSKALTTALGLAEDADEKTIAAAIAKRDEAVTAAEAKATEAAEKLTATVAELEALRSTATDAEKKLAAMEGTVETIRKEQWDARATAMLDKAIYDTKMDPAERGAMLELAEKAGIDTVQALITARPARPLNLGRGSGRDGVRASERRGTKIDGAEVPVDEASAELADLVDAHLESLKLDHEATVEEYLAAHDHVVRTMTA